MLRKELKLTGHCLFYQPTGFPLRLPLPCTTFQEIRRTMIPAHSSERSLEIRRVRISQSLLKSASEGKQWEAKLGDNLLLEKCNLGLHGGEAWQVEVGKQPKSFDLRTTKPIYSAGHKEMLKFEKRQSRSWHLTTPRVPFTTTCNGLPVHGLE